MLLEFAPGIFKRLIHAATSRSRMHNFFDRNFRSPPVISSHVVAHVALGGDADQLAALFIAACHFSALTLMSVWCFFAAILSLVIYAYFNQELRVEP